MSLIIRFIILAGVIMNLSQPVKYRDGAITAEYLSGIINKARLKYKIPAIAVSIMSSDEIYLQEIQGVRVYNETTKARLDDYFHIGSCSKSVLAVMAGKLVDEKKISWQTKFFDIFPELKDKSNPAYLSITLEDLFLCEAGIKPFTDGESEPFPEIDPSADDQRLEFIHYLIQQPSASEKKDGRFQHLYSNASYVMASAMLERVSGLSYEELVTKTINDDLGLSVRIGWPNSYSIDQPWGHLIANGKVDAFPPDHDYKLPYLITPAGDLSMTPQDYSRYTQMHLKGLRGESNYISSETYNRIHFGRDGFALGVANGKLGGKRFSGFDGSAGTFFCRSIIFPESDFAFAIMMNAGSGTGSMKAVDWLTTQIIKKHYNWWWMFWL